MLGKEYGAHLAVWAIATNDIDELYSQNNRDDVLILHAPSAPNANLSAQAGLFTLALYTHENVGLEDILYEHPSLKDKTFPGIVCNATMPVTEARSLMKRLALLGYSAATMFPGYDGVRMALDEQRWWDRENRTGRAPWLSAGRWRRARALRRLRGR
jgi:hypothetical protein